MSHPASGPTVAGGTSGAGGDDHVVDPLDDIRLLLDPLTPSSAPETLTSTTIEMVAVSSAGRPGERKKSARRPIRSLWGAAGCVLAALLIGLAMGRATTSDPDERILEYLPVVEHLGVLQEAGSVAFLRSVAERDYPPPRRFPFGRPPEGREGGDRPRFDQPASAPADEGWLQLNETLEALQEGPFGPETPASEIDARREHVEELDDDARRRLADAAKAFQELPLSRRHDIVELARALGDGDDPEGELQTLLAAARSWHQWVAWRDPADRHAVVALDATDRLEWLDRYARFNVRPMFPMGPSGRGGPEGRGFGGERGDRSREGRDRRPGADAERRNGGANVPDAATGSRRRSAPEQTTPAAG